MLEAARYSSCTMSPSSQQAEQCFLEKSLAVHLRMLTCALDLSLGPSILYIGIKPFSLRAACPNCSNRVCNLMSIESFCFISFSVFTLWLKSSFCGFFQSYWAQVHQPLLPFDNLLDVLQTHPPLVKLLHTHISSYIYLGLFLHIFQPLMLFW